MTYPAFKAYWPLRNPHLQTILASTRRPDSRIHLTYDYIDITGDRLELVWLDQHLAHTQPILLLIHGLEGSVYSDYIQALMCQAAHHKFSMVTLHFRGCDGRVNQLAEGYHAGQSQDIATTVNYLSQHYSSPLFSAGFSLGANALLKYLGESPLNPLQSAAAVSTPFNLASSCAQLEKSSNKLYTIPFFKKLKTHRAK